MERQAAYDLFSCFLEKRGIKGIDVKKELPGLLAYGYDKGLFLNPHTVHELQEWRKFGDKLWEATLEDDKTAKRLGKLWKVVHNELLQHQAEKKAAQQANVAQSKNRDYSGWSECPLPPATATVTLPPPAPASSPPADSARPTAPPEPWPGGPQLRGGNEPIPGVESDLAEAIAKERREAWAALAKDCMEAGDSGALGAAQDVACPVMYTPLAGGGLQAAITPLDWKLLSQLRATVSQFGVKSEPVKQMLDYIWGTQLLLPGDCRALAKLIFSQHQQLLFSAHWQALCQQCTQVQRPLGDPLHGVTLAELMGLGAFVRTEAQALLGPDKCREAMRLAREAMDLVKEPGGIPSYMGIKQGKDEAFGSFIDKVASAIERAGVPDYMKGAMLKQCATQNSNAATKNILSTLGWEWIIEQALERLSGVPTGPQAMLVEAIKELGAGLHKQAEAVQTQVLAALAPLQASAITGVKAPSNGRIRCYRCGGMGHIRRDCQATSLWCQKCRVDSHNTGACRRRPGNSKGSANEANSSRAQTQIAAAQQQAPVPSYGPPPPGASAWTWQPQ